MGSAIVDAAMRWWFRWEAVPELVEALSCLLFYMYSCNKNCNAYLPYWNLFWFLLCEKRV